MLHEAVNPHRRLRHLLAPLISFPMPEGAHFWVAHPIGINAIAAAYLPVPFAPLWWPELDWSRRRVWGWTTAATLLAAIYAGLFGLFFHKSCDPLWQKAVAFALLPVAASCSVYATYALTHRRDHSSHSRYTTPRRFCLLLPPVLATFSALTALTALAPLSEADGAPRLLFVMAHALNGLVVGMGTLAMTCYLKLMRQFWPPPPVE